MAWSRDICLVWNRVVNLKEACVNLISRAGLEVQTSLGLNQLCLSESHKNIKFIYSTC